MTDAGTSAALVETQWAGPREEEKCEDAGTGGRDAGGGEVSGVWAWHEDL